MLLKNSKKISFIILFIFMIITIISNSSIAIGESKTSSNSSKQALNRAELQKRLEHAVPSKSSIMKSIIDDFGKNKHYEMFSLIEDGNTIRNNFFSGQVWFTDKKSSKKLFEGSMYLNTVKVWDVGIKKLFYIEEGSGGSGSISHVWSIREGKPYELSNSGEGLEYVGNKQFYTYPSAFDLFVNELGGHTWKRYYLYFDEKSGGFKEYGGIKIDVNQLKNFSGATSLINEINKCKYKITDIFYRSNGIINVGYTDGEYNLVSTLSTKDGKVTNIEPKSIKNPNFDQCGKYQAAFFKAIATFPKNVG